MNSQEKYIIQQKTRQKYNLLRFTTGLKAIKNRRYARIIAAAYAIIVVLVGFYVFGRSNQNADVFEIIHMAIWRLLYPLLVPITTIFFGYAAWHTVWIYGYKRKPMASRYY